MRRPTPSACEPFQLDSTPKTDSTQVSLYLLLISNVPGVPIFHLFPRHARSRLYSDPCQRAGVSERWWTSSPGAALELLEAAAVQAHAPKSLSSCRELSMRQKWLSHPGFDRAALVGAS